MLDGIWISVSYHVRSVVGSHNDGVVEEGGVDVAISSKWLLQLFHCSWCLSDSVSLLAPTEAE